MTVDYGKRRKSLLNDRTGAYFDSGFGAALMDDAWIERVDEESLIARALRHGFSLERYRRNEGGISCGY